MGIVFILCGKTGSGKSTLAKFIECNYNSVNFSVDKFMIKLFGEIKDRELFESKLSTCKSIIYEMSDSILKYSNVVFDFGFWTKEERNFIMRRFKNYKIIMIYTKLDDKIILERLVHRNSCLGESEYYIDEKTFRTLSSKFEEPDETEDFISYTGDEQLQKDIYKKIKRYLKNEKP